MNIRVIITLVAFVVQARLSYGVYAATGVQAASPLPPSCLASPVEQIGVPVCNGDGRYGFISYTEGNLRETFPLFSLSCAQGPSLNLALTYNSFSASGTDFRADTVLGFGWTHTYNLFISEYPLMPISIAAMEELQSFGTSRTVPISPLQDTLKRYGSIRMMLTSSS